MTDTSQQVGEYEQRLVRVFFVSRPMDMTRGETLTRQQIEGSLGVYGLNFDDIQQVWTHDLDDLTITEFLRSGYDISQDHLAPHAEALEAAGEVDAIFVIVRSGAFRDRPVTINYAGLLVHMATFREPGANVQFEPLPDGGTKGPIEDPPQKKPASDAAMSGRVATLALLVMALLVVLMIWIAG